jgi:hypothetical protein
MRFFLSAEVDVAVHEHVRRVQNGIEAKLNEFLADREYGPMLKKIAIIPMILRPEWQAGHRERRLFQRKQGAADYRTWIDYEKMRTGPDELRERLLLKNIAEAVADLSRKAGKGFAGERLIEEMLSLFGVTRSQVDSA